MLRLNTFGGLVLQQDGQLHTGPASQRRRLGAARRGRGGRPAGVEPRQAALPALAGQRGRGGASLALSGGARHPPLGGERRDLPRRHDPAAQSRAHHQRRRRVRGGGGDRLARAGRAAVPRSRSWTASGWRTLPSTSSGRMASGCCTPGSTPRPWSRWPPRRPRAATTRPRSAGGAGWPRRSRSARGGAWADRSPRRGRRPRRRAPVRRGAPLPGAPAPGDRARSGDRALDRAAPLGRGPGGGARAAAAPRLRPRGGREAAARELDEIRRALSERYQVGDRIGESTLLLSFAARDRRDTREVELHVLSPRLVGLGGGERVLDALERVVALREPRIVPMREAGAIQGRIYFATPPLEGASLRDRLARERQLPVADVRRIAAGAARRAGVRPRPRRPPRRPPAQARPARPQRSDRRGLRPGRGARPRRVGQRGQHRGHHRRPGVSLPRATRRREQRRRAERPLQPGLHRSSRCSPASRRSAAAIWRRC